MSDNPSINPGHDILANVIMYILKHEAISGADIINRFKLSIEATTNIITTMGASGIIGPEEAGVHPVTAKCLDDINEGIVEFLNDHGFTKEMIVDAFRTLTTEEKEEVSIILNEKRDWRDASQVKPDLNVPVAIRLVNKSMIYTENKAEVLYAEDIKIAQWDGEKWTIIPPYPKFDYSPLSKHSELKEGTEVSHWGDILAEELENWQRRFDRFYDYDLHIEVDPEHEEDVYRALMWGAAYISKFGGPDFHNDVEENGLQKMYKILCDMQACMDTHQEDEPVSEVVINMADHIVSTAAQESTNGTYDFPFKEIINQTSKEWMNVHLHDVVYDLICRDEITDVHIDYADGTIQCAIDPRYCPNYEWEEGDEEIFGCSKEEWEQIEPLKVHLKRGNE